MQSKSFDVNFLSNVFTNLSDEIQQWSVAMVTRLLWILWSCWYGCTHYSDVIMGAIASQITSLPIVYSTVYSGADQRRHVIRAPRHWLLCGEFTGHRCIYPHKWPVTRKRFHLMTSSCIVMYNRSRYKNIFLSVNVTSPWDVLLDLLVCVPSLEYPTCFVK